MRVVCQQPNYFPWLGYFEQIARADAFVVLDSVQWIRQGRQHRTRLPPPSSRSCESSRFWLTVPVQGRSHRSRSLREMEIDHSQNWQRRHWNTLVALYGKAPYFRSQLESLVRPFLEQAKFRFLAELCEKSLELFWEPLGLRAARYRSSEMGAEGRKTELLLHLCQALGADEYYSALGSSRYLDQNRFRSAGIQVRWQHFRASALDPLRACDYSILDWLAHCEWKEIRSKLGTATIDRPSSAPDVGASVLR